MTGADDRLTPEELRAALNETLGSVGWREVILPSLRRDLDNVQRQLLDERKDIEAIRELQARGKMLRRWIENPREVFKVESGP